MKKIINLILIGLFFITTLAAVPTDFILAKDNHVKLYFFYGETCPHCKKANIFLKKLEQKYPNLEIKHYEVFDNKENAQLLLKLFENCGQEKTIRVPAIFVGPEVIVGYLDDEITGARLQKAVEKCLGGECLDPLVGVNQCQFCDCQGEKDCDCQTCICPTENSEARIISFPLIGKIDLSKLSLPVLTIVVGALDGFNPCAMWILIFLLAMLINIRSRRRMWLIGGTFILVSGIIYYLLLAAWLNLFLAISYVSLTRLIIGAAALFFGAWQIKKFRDYQTGVCTVTEGNSRLQDGLRRRAQSVVNNPVLILSLLGVVVLAAAVNLIEFFCSAGLPAIYTRILALSHLNPVSYYLYLFLYTLIFMLDDLIVFIVAVVTLSHFGASDKYNKWSTLIGGVLIALLGILMILRPEWLIFG